MVAPWPQPNPEHLVPTQIQRIRFWRVQGVWFLVLSVYGEQSTFWWCILTSLFMFLKCWKEAHVLTRNGLLRNTSGA